MKKFISENNIKKQSISGRKIFIDFDDSLFNTKKFRGGLLEVFLKNGVSRKHFLETYYDYPQKTSHVLKKYDPEKQIEKLKKKLPKNEQRIKNDLRKFIKNQEQYVFSDAKNFLQSFKKEKLFLVSYGQADFQLKKMKNSGLFFCFKKVFITDQGKSAITNNFVAKNETFAFIDDRIENINSIKKHFPASITFLLKRKEGRYNDKKTKYVDFEIRNLTEAKKIIEKNFGKAKRKKT